MSAAPSVEMPIRTSTGLTDDAVPEFDPHTTTGVLAERLQAWKHACGYLEDYMSAMEKAHGKQAKEYEKVLKTISNPLREGHHFDQNVGGIAGFFENMRSNTQAMINTSIETEKSIKGSVLPILERLHKEIKHKAKELESGAGASAKEVEKLRNTTQKQIELLGEKTAAFDSTGGKFSGTDDPYIVRRGVVHRLSNQVIAENNHSNDLISVQNNFQVFEGNIIHTLQQAMQAFAQLSGGQSEKITALHNDMLGTIQCVPKEFEWINFVSRCSDVLVDPQEPARSIDNVTFANEDHPSTKALIEGTLERKSRNKLSFGWSTGYYVVTPSRFLHEFKDTDDNRQDPKPELSLFLPDATIGIPSENKFNIRGKDKSGTLSSKFAGTTELSFKAHTAADAQKWFHIIQAVCGATAPAEANSDPSSPASPAAASPAAVGAASPSSTAAVVDEKAAVPATDDLKMNTPIASPPVASPVAAAPAAATPAHQPQETGILGTPVTSAAQTAALTAVQGHAKVDEKPVVGSAI
ncbi:Putative PH domain-containing protein [[Torrubiella] hemipterigena]|uniref:Putative PH domain-containing protein n=1 Tax=[Torrubiella] hemipterigena TaxID=1531966 RepID=A0A0A1T1K5_9HYPO|nr:Putative PH domain-containing protein [[Torrubiella] hemipterigena]